MSDNRIRLSFWTIVFRPAVNAKLPFFHNILYYNWLVFIFRLAVYLLYVYIATMSKVCAYAP